MSKKLIFYSIVKYILFFVLFLILQFAEIGGMKPFAFGMLFALVWCNQKIFVVAPLYVVSALVAEPSIQSFVSAFVCATIFVLFFFLHLKLKKPLNKIFIGLYAFLSQSAYIYFNSFSLNSFLSALCCLIVGMICLFCYLFFMQSLLLRGLRRKYAFDELICMGVFLIALGAGIANIPNMFVVTKGLFVLLVLIFSYIFSASASLSFSVLLGVGNLLSVGDMKMFLLLSLFALVSNLSKSSRSIFYVLYVLIIDIFTNLYFFSSFTLSDFLPTMVACVLFLLLSIKTLKKLQSFVIAENEDFSARFLINKSKQNLSKKLLDTSNLFLAMQNMFVSMSKTNLSPNQAVKFCADEAKKQICKKCPKFEFCSKQNPAIFSHIQTLSALALSRGKLSFFDVPSGFSSSCKKNAVFVETINQISKDYKNFCTLSNTLDSSRLLVADQLFGVSQLLESLSTAANSKIVFSPQKENALCDELLTNQILCTEVLLNFSENKICDVTLIIKNTDLNHEKICKIAQKVLRQKLEVSAVEPSNKQGFSVVVLKPKVFFDVVFGCAGALKHGSVVSGDNHSALRICENKIMMALCDGMGSGTQANKISALSLDLIEKFYRSGFDTNLILENVNRLLSMREEENFGALDICVFDLELCGCDVLKLGAPVSFLKQKDETKTLKAGALPLGILKNVKPNVQSFALCDGDMVVLVTDGIIDALKSIDGLKNEINNITSKNPQQVAEKILQISLDACEGMPPDDMTVLVGKIWRKI